MTMGLFYALRIGRGRNRGAGPRRCGHTPGTTCGGKAPAPLLRRSSDERRPGREAGTPGLSGQQTPRSASSSQRPVTLAGAMGAASAHLLPVQALLRWDVLVDGFAAVLADHQEAVAA